MDEFNMNEARGHRTKVEEIVGFICRSKQCLLL
jgi:hypothetical protein